MANKPNTPTAILVEVQAPTEYIDRSFETASWWVKYEIQPGKYQVMLDEFGYGYFRAECKRIEEHFVNRLFHATSLVPQSSYIGRIESQRIPFIGKYLWYDQKWIDRFHEYHPTFKVHNFKVLSREVVSE